MVTLSLTPESEPVSKAKAPATTKAQTTKKASASRKTTKQQDEESCIILTKDDIEMFHGGIWQRSWEKMGAHQDTVDGVDGWRFRLWAPDVEGCSVVGDFNGWDPEANPFSPAADDPEIWCAFIPGLKQGDLYKFVIKTDEGKLLWKADPYAFADEAAPGTASKLWSLDGYKWGDGRWLASRRRRNMMKNPLNIYEVHLGSWKRHGNEPQGDPDENGNYPGPGDPFPAQRGTYYTYDDLSEELVEYVSDMGYTHIEVMPVMEHPFDGSWGYQPTGYYAATARYGTPQQLMHFVDSCHQAGIGVILDWVPGGFCADEQGLATFNGHMLYEREIHPNWGTHKFDYGRPEVRSFLVSNALFWIEMFHADGIRMDGVSSMLYLNFGVDNPADKKFNKYGTEEDLDASAFIRQVNCAVGREFPDVMMIAEESTAWPLVTYPPEDGGLGFHFKWDMGWMNDTLQYMQTDFPWRPGNHGKITFSMMYAFNENFILPLSHDEVVNGKCSLITRMPGDQWRQFAGLRALAFYQMTHSGAKLNFMGNEIGQYIEWRYYESIEWFLAEQYEVHAKQQAFIKALNHFYKDQPALWQHSFDEEGFKWIDADDSEQSIISFVRHGNRLADDLVVLINFDPRSYQNFRMGVPREGDYQEVFNTDDAEFGGTGGYREEGVISSHPDPWNGQKQSIKLKVPPLGGIVLKRVGHSSYKPPKKTAKRSSTAKKATTADKDAKVATAEKATSTKDAEAAASKTGKAASAKGAVKTAATATAETAAKAAKATGKAADAAGKAAKTVKVKVRTSSAAGTATGTESSSKTSSEETADGAAKTTN